ncbi:hypothetical protein DsansV1_C09g0087841 [Dioscorea sansibarensis]
MHGFLSEIFSVACLLPKEICPAMHLSRHTSCISLCVVFFSVSPHMQ